MGIIWHALRYTVLRGLWYGGALGAVYGTFLTPVIGTIIGLLSGAIAGVVVGIPLGIIIGWITYQFFTPVRNPLSYGWAIGVGVAVLSYIGTILCLSKIYDAWPPSSIFVQIPAFIAVGAATYAGLGFAKEHIEEQVEYENEKPKRKERYA